MYTRMLTSLLLSLFLLLTPLWANAAPAFSRQTGMNCATCHFTSFPALNAFGRSFRAGGYTMVGKQDTIQGDDLALPSSLNMSIITKLRLQQSSAGTSIAWPDEAAFLVGGKLADDIGFLMELGLAGAAVEGTAPAGGGAITGGAANALLSSKIHFNLFKSGNTQFSIIPYSTDGLGAGFGFELLNTGAQRSVRPIEDRNGFSAAQKLKVGSGAATGFAFVASSHDYFVNLSEYTPGWWNTNTSALSGWGNYLRFAYMPRLGGWDSGFGIQYISGNVKNGGTPTNMNAWVLDGQMEGKLAGKDAGFYLSYGSAAANTVQNTNSAAATALGLLAKVAVVPKTSFYLAAMNYADGTGAAATTSTTIGAEHRMRQNVKLELYSQSSGSTILQLFAGF